MLPVHQTSLPYDPANRMSEDRSVYLLRGLCDDSIGATGVLILPKLRTTVCQARNVTWQSGPIQSRYPSLYVKITVGNVTRETRIIKDTLYPTWDEDILL